MGRLQITVALLLACAIAPISMSAKEPPRAAGHELSRTHPPIARLLREDDGLAIIAAALRIRSELNSEYDCSHLVHAVYQQAGFPYKYATAAQLYAGVGEFRRVFHPQAGDLVTFPQHGAHGHVGIMVDPHQRLFFSHLSHGPSVSSYGSPYWRHRGIPHFLRYVRKLPPGTRTASAGQLSTAR